MTAGKPIEIGLYMLKVKECIAQFANKRPFDRDTWNKTPATRMRLETIKSHESCNAHKNAVRQEAEVRRCETITENIQPEICLSSTAKTFACVHTFCAKTESLTQLILGL